MIKHTGKNTFLLLQWSTNNYQIDITRSCFSIYISSLFWVHLFVFTPFTGFLCMHFFVFGVISQASHGEEPGAIRKNKTNSNKKQMYKSLAYQFVLAAVDVCLMCKTNGYWADFINPFSGRPYFTQRKDSNLYKTDERFRCLGFQIELRNNCRVIACDDSPRSFIGT